MGVRESGWYWVKKWDYADDGDPWVVAYWSEYHESWMKEGWEHSEAEVDGYWDEIDERRIVREDPADGR